MLKNETLMFLKLLFNKKIKYIQMYKFENLPHKYFVAGDGKIDINF